MRNLYGEKLIIICRSVDGHKIIIMNDFEDVFNNEPCSAVRESLCMY